MKPGDEILIRAKLINVRERDNEATVGFDSTTTVVVPLGAVMPTEPGLREAAIRNSTIEEIASFAETHYCIIDANSLGGYKTCERPKHPNEPFARAIRALMDCAGGRAATDAPKETKP